MTGSVFKVQALLLLLVVVGLEAAGLAVADIRAAAIWAIVNLAVIQAGYLAGIFGRRALEQAGYVMPPVGVRRP